MAQAESTGTVAGSGERALRGAETRTASWRGLLGRLLAPDAPRPATPPPATPPRAAPPPRGEPLQHLTAQPAREAAFAAARRHSKRVRFLRRAIPLGTIAVLVGMVAWSFLRPLGASLPGLDVAGVGLSGSRVTMSLPRLTGFKKDSKSYEVTASRADQDIRQPHVVELTDLDARVEMEKNSFARLKAKGGVLDTQAETLHLSRAVEVVTDTGYRFQTEQADVAFKTGEVNSRTAVRVFSDSFDIQAAGVEVRDNGKYIIFPGPVRSVFTPAEQEQVQ
jgi:lipopolysaccharide export system protein LptC